MFCKAKATRDATEEEVINSFLRPLRPLTLPSFMGLFKSVVRNWLDVTHFCVVVLPSVPAIVTFDAFCTDLSI